MGRHWPDEIAERRRVKRAERARVRDEIEEEASGVRLQKVRHCSVPGHGTRCVVAQELEPDRYPRCTEERIALDHEIAADEPENVTPSA